MYNMYNRVVPKVMKFFISGPKNYFQPGKCTPGPTESISVFIFTLAQVNIFAHQFEVLAISHCSLQRDRIA